MNILIVRLSAIGDCCLVLPVVRAILEKNKNAKICWLIGEAAYQLLQFSEHPRLEYKVIKKPKSILDYLNIRKEFKYQKFDYLLAMQASTRANLIYPFINADKKVGFDTKRARELQWLVTNEKIRFKKEHLHESFCQFANLLGVSTSNLDWEIVVPSDSNVLKRYRINHDFIVINPAASKLERSWKSERYARLIEWLNSEYEVEVVLTGSNASFEVELAKRIEKQSKAKIKNLVGKTNLIELAGLLKKAQLVVAPDTGPAHIANGLGTAVVGLFAVAPSWLSAPYNYKEYVVDEYQAAVKHFLNKDVESIEWGVRVHSRAAMDLIDIEVVKTKITKALDC